MISLSLAPLLAMTSPWWEDYEVRERFLCGDRGGLVVERGPWSPDGVGNAAGWFDITGVPIAVVRVAYDSVGVDVPADVARVEQLLAAAR